MTFNVSLILLYNKDGRVLLQHRTDDAPVLPGCWAFFGGRLKKGETPLEAVKREAKEELDYELRDPSLVFTHEFEEGVNRGNLYVFTQPFMDHLSVLRLQEGKGWGWFEAAEIDTLNMVQRDRDILKALWNYLGRGGKDV